MKYLILVLLVFALPAVSTAQTASITPQSLDFGDVLVGESASISLHLESVESTPLQVFSLSIVDDPSSPFAITEQTIVTVVEIAIVTAPERALRETVWCVFVLDVLCSQTKLAVLRFNIER